MYNAYKPKNYHAKFKSINVKIKSLMSHAKDASCERTKTNEKRFYRLFSLVLRTWNHTNSQRMIIEKQAQS